MYPATSEKNRTPTSIALVSLSLRIVGVAVPGNRVPVVTGVGVVNDQDVLPIAFPTVSLAPFTVAVYVVLVASALVGVIVAFIAAASYVNVEGTTVPFPSLRTKVKLPAW